MIETEVDEVCILMDVLKDKLEELLPELERLKALTEKDN